MVNDNIHDIAGSMIDTRIKIENECSPQEGIEAQRSFPLFTMMIMEIAPTVNGIHIDFWSDNNAPHSENHGHIHTTEKRQKKSESKASICSSINKKLFAQKRV